MEKDQEIARLRFTLREVLRMLDEARVVECQKLIRIALRPR